MRFCPRTAFSPCVRTSAVWSVGILLALSAFLSLAVPARAWEVDATATVTSVIDGDTFDSTPTGRIRLADIDAPESGVAGYDEARDFLSGLIGGQTVYLDTDDVYGTDVYGRWVAVVYVRHNATHLENVNEALLESGHAVIWDFDNEFDPAAWALYVFYPVAAPAPTVTVSADPAEGVAPLTVAFSSTPSGGIPPYSFSWDFKDGGTSSLQNPIHTFRVGGTFSVSLTVTDAASRTVTGTVRITVSESLSTPGGPESGPASLVYSSLAGVAIVVIIVGFLLLQRRGRTRP